MDGPEAVYHLCALLCHLLTGRALSVEGMRTRRAGLRAGLQGLGLEQGAETALLSLLDHGLRLEPSRRSQIQRHCALPCGKFRRP